MGNGSVPLIALGCGLLVTGYLLALVETLLLHMDIHVSYALYYTLLYTGGLFLLIVGTALFAVARLVPVEVAE
jgi:hypothetical protein